MSTEAKAIDPRLTFNYAVEIDGLEVAFVKKVTIPPVSVEKVEHKGAGAAWATKTAGRLVFEDITLEKVMPADRSDKWAWNWLTTARNPRTGAGASPSAYKKNISIIHYGHARQIIDKWNVEGVFPISVEYTDGDSDQDNERIVETITLSQDRHTRV